MVTQRRDPQRSQEAIGPYTSEFSGLNLTSKGGGLPPSAATIMHNCEVAPDGSVVRRGGTNDLRNLPTGSGRTWSQSVRSKTGLEYVISVSQSGINITLFSSIAQDVPISRVTGNKLNVWSRPLTDVQFLVLSTPYDRIIIFTGNHPPVQVSLLDREVAFTCTVVNQRLVGVTRPRDSPLWNHTGSGTYLYDRASNEVFLASIKRPGFDVDVPIVQALNAVRTLTIIQDTWHWWAEATYWEGSDFAASSTRFHTAATDQNVRIPPSVVTDLDVRVGDSALRGVYIAQSLPITTLPVAPRANPTVEGEWGHGNGTRFTTAANASLPHTPFFATWGGVNGTPTLTQPNHFLRARELRFNAGQGIQPQFLDVFVDGRLATFRSTYSTAFGTGDYIANVVTTPSSVRTDTPATLATQVCQNIFPFANGSIPSSTTTFVMVNKQNAWMGSAGRAVKYDSIPASGGIVDGTYIPIFGIGAFTDYARGVFTDFGTMFRDRLVLRGTTTAADQVLISATSDYLSPGEFYHYFQVTDALASVADDPFTVNITARSRERVTSFVSWQQSIIVFTAVSTYAINAGDAFGPDGYSTIFVASYGAFNNRCALVANESVLFMNRFGVFDLQNKNNNSEFASFERSEAIRPIFTDDQLTDRQDNLPWLSLNDSTGTLYVGLPAALDTLVCSRNLSLSLAWNAWATFAGAVPFSSTSASMVGRHTIMTVLSPLSDNPMLLVLGAPHNLDYMRFTGVLTFPNTTRVPVNAITGKIVRGGYFPVPHPLMPLLNEFQCTTFGPPIGTLTSKLGFKVKTGDVVGAQSGVFSSNWSNGLVPASFNSLVRGVNSTSPRVFGITYSAWNLDTLPNFTATGSVTGETTVEAYGLIYPSIYSSPVFNLGSLGKLKRLKKLDILMGTASSNDARYPINNDQGPITGSGAIVMLTSNYNEGTTTVDTTYVNSNTALDAQRLDETQEAREVELLSIPLQGYGASYQFTVVSVGAESFKILGYEVEATLQRGRTFTSNPGA